MSARRIVETADILELLEIVAKLRLQLDEAVRDGRRDVAEHPDSHPYETSGHSYALGSLGQRVSGIAGELEVRLKRMAGRHR